MVITLKKSQRFYDCIVEGGSKLLNLFVGAVGPGSIGEQRHSQFALRVDP